MKFIMLFVLLLVSPVVAIVSQENICSTFIAETLPQITNTCSDVDLNEACYGNNRVDATFYEEHDELVFNAPSDRVDLIALQSIATAPLSLDESLWGVAVLSVQANLAYTLPGQAVTFLLMGDVTLENDVLPDDALVGSEPIAGIVNGDANIRSQPMTTANVVQSLSAGDAVQVIGMTEAGDWYEVILDGKGTAWIWAGLVGIGETGTLPITYRQGQPLYAPMQAFYFTAGIGTLACNEAPNALIIQNPQGANVILRINDLNMTIGSTVVVTMGTVDDENVLVLSLIEGSLKSELATLPIELNQAGETIAITLNANNRVDNNSQQVDFNSDDFSAIIQNTCNNASSTGLFNNQCDIELVAADSNPPTNIVIPADGLCTVVSINDVNLRDGPGTNYGQQGQLASGQSAHPTGKTNGIDGYLWWQLTGGAWVRSDLVSNGGICDTVPLVDAPLPPVTEIRPDIIPATITYYEIGYCDMQNITAGEFLIFQDGIGRWPTVEEAQAALAGHSASITLDGVPLSVFYEGITQHGPDGFGDRARASWTATSGTHTVSGYWTIHGGTDTCTFSVP